MEVYIYGYGKNEGEKNLESGMEMTQAQEKLPQDNPRTDFE